MKFKNSLINKCKEIIYFIIGNILFFKFIRIVVYKKFINKIFVINYHNTYGVHEKNFIWQINFYKKYFKIIDYQKLVQIKKNKKIVSKKPLLLITFDDGHRSNFEIATKVLNPRKIKAIFFIAPKFINYRWPNNLIKQCMISRKKFNIPCNYNFEKKDNRRRIAMTWKDIKNLKNSGHTIGSHGMSHVRLSNKLNKKKINYEISTSKKFLQKKFKTKIETFCWIGGERWAYSFNAHKAIKKANYKYSFMTCAKIFDPIRDDKYKVHRFNIESFFSKNRVRATISFFYSLYYLPKRKYIDKIIK